MAAFLARAQMASPQIAAEDEFFRASFGGLRVKFLKVRLHTDHLARLVAIPAI